MVEALGVAAGALGIASFGVQLADSVVKLKRFCGEVKGVPRKLHRLTEELGIMTEALSMFTVDYEKLLATKNPVRKSLALCEAAVKDLASTVNTLDDRLSRRKRVTSIYAALRREEVDDLVENMERTRNLLDFVSRVYLEAQRQNELSSILVYCRTNDSAASSSTVGMAVRQATADNGSAAQQEIETIRRSPVPTSGALGRPRGLEYRASSWLFSRVWELSVERASSGWKFSLLFQKILPEGHPVLSACIRYEVGQMQKLVCDGEILPDDKIELNPTRGLLSLITISALFGRNDIVRYLLSQGADPGILAREFDSSLVLVLIMRLLKCNSTIDTVIEDVKFLSELCVFDNETLDFPGIYWRNRGTLRTGIFLRPRASWSMHENLRTFGSILLNFADVSPRFLQLVEPALIEQAYFAAQVDMPNQPRLMHLLAECAGSIEEDTWRTYRHELAALVAAGIRADTCLHVLSRTGSGMTPLMHALFGAMLKFQIDFVQSRGNFDSAVTAVQNRFQRWLTLLAEAGVDLFKYATREANLFGRHWRASQRVLWLSCYGHCDVIALRFGRKVADWGVWVSHPGDCYSGQFWDMVEHPERSIPGAWMESEEFDPEPITWRTPHFIRT